ATRFRRAETGCCFSAPSALSDTMHPEPTASEPCATCGAAAGLRHTGQAGGLDLHVWGTLHVVEASYLLSGAVSGSGAALLGEGSSVQVRSLTTGLTEEAFLDGAGQFQQAVEVQPENDNELELAVCDPSGRELACVVVRLCPCRPGQARGGGAPATAAEGQALEPLWPQFARLVRHCLDLAAALADASGRKREELFEHIYTQERY